MSSTKSKTTLPLTITGGCLCASIRYSISFPENAEWPPKDTWTCQCTQCRKFTGCLLPHIISIPTSHISPAFSTPTSNDSTSTLKTFESSPKAYRSFCSRCGSSVAFNERETPELTEIFMGTLDEEVLCGEWIKSVEGAESEGTAQRDGTGMGEELCKVRQHMWAENRIMGVTDELVGHVYKRDRE